MRQDLLRMPRLPLRRNRVTRIIRIVLVAGAVVVGSGAGGTLRPSGWAATVVCTATTVRAAQVPQIESTPILPQHISTPSGGRYNPTA